MKYMAANFFKLEKFEGVDFRRWQKKTHFLLSSMSVVYVLSIQQFHMMGMMPQWKRKRMSKWENVDYICRGLILTGMSNPLFDIYQNIESEK